MTQTLVCERCGGVQEVRLEDAEGLPLTVAEYRTLLAVTGHTVVCDRCTRADDARR